VAARRCILEGGYHNTRVEVIAKEAGLSKGAVYFHFQSKRGLLFALVEHEFQSALRIFDAAGASDDTLGSAAAAFFAFMGDTEDPRHRLFLLTGELALHDEELRLRLMGHHEALLDRLADLLSRGAKAAGFELADPRAMAVLLKAMADGLQGAAALGGEVDHGRLLMALAGLLAAARTV
jgi:AcrR family transcriptional regulator